MGLFRGLMQFLCQNHGSLRVLSSILAVLLEPLSQFVGHTSQCSNHHCCWRSSMIGWEDVWATQTGWHWWVILFMKDPCKHLQTTNLQSPTTRKLLSGIIAANLSRQVSQHLSEAKQQLSVDYKTRQTNQPEPRLDWLHHAVLPEVNKTLTYWSTSHKHKHVMF